MKRLFNHQFQLSPEWCFEIDWKTSYAFGFLIAPAAIHFRIWRLWFSLVNEGYLYAVDGALKRDFWWREKIYEGSSDNLMWMKYRPTKHRKDGGDSWVHSNRQ